MAQLNNENIAGIRKIIIDILYQANNNQNCDRLSLRENLHFWLELLAKNNLDIYKVFSAETLIMIENFLKNKESKYQTNLSNLLNIAAKNNRKSTNDIKMLGKELEELIKLINLILSFDQEPICGYGSLIDNVLTIIECKIGVTYNSYDLNLQKRLLLLKEHCKKNNLSYLAEKFNKLAKEVENKKCADYQRSNSFLEQEGNYKKKNKKQKEKTDKKDDKKKNKKDNNLDKKEKTDKKRQINLSVARIKELLNNFDNKKNIAGNIATELSNIERNLGISSTNSSTVSNDRIKGIKTEISNSELDFEDGEVGNKLLNNFNNLSLENNLENINESKLKASLKGGFNNNSAMRNLTISKKIVGRFSSNVLNSNKNIINQKESPSMNFILQSKKDKK